jgi:hypothetical protein
VIIAVQIWSADIKFSTQPQLLDKEDRGIWTPTRLHNLLLFLISARHRLSVCVIPNRLIVCFLWQTIRRLYAAHQHSNHTHTAPVVWPGSTLEREWLTLDKAAKIRDSKGEVSVWLFICKQNKKRRVPGGRDVTLLGKWYTQKAYRVVPRGWAQKQTRKSKGLPRYALWMRVCDTLLYNTNVLKLTQSQFLGSSSIRIWAIAGRNRKPAHLPRLRRVKKELSFEKFKRTVTVTSWTAGDAGPEDGKGGGWMEKCKVSYTSSLRPHMRPHMRP